ncbi:QWRF motif-containing protein 3 [Juglans microcarpa x Juglans regia]|uniref:QWRF motif-containing protein 3 n=1 Tax=Juglans microcarpa x Juglans regia TaxID=2249226 RepID=UPI001B7EF0B6|nr:QWRF motif-containing protein 3 [Juglans microcarpa x Juglans regia]
MKTEDNAQVVLSGDDQSFKLRRASRRSREVTSRFLSPSSLTSNETGIPSPNNQSFSPTRRKHITSSPTSSTNSRRQRSLDDSAGLIHQLWPSSATSSSTKSTKNLGTLADHLGNERLKDRKNDKKTANDNDPFLDSRFENEKEISTKENQRPSLGRSMRYTGKLAFPGKSSSSSLLNSSAKTSSGFLSGRLSVDENKIFRKTYGKSDSFPNTSELESEFSDVGSGADLGSSAIGKILVSSRKSEAEVSFKYMRDASAMRVSDSNISHPTSCDNFPRTNKFTIKNVIKRVNSLTDAKSQWALSPGRSSSPPMSVESKAKPMSFSSLKPPNSPSRATGMEKLLNIGLDLLKRKKSSTSSSMSMVPGSLESVHQLRLLHNRLLQWRYANARAKAVKVSIAIQAERNLLCGWDGLTKLRQSVVQKKLQLEKEKLDIKLNYILHSQIKLLEAWGGMERQHLSAVSKTKECLHTVVCKVPLTDGAKVDIQLATNTLGDALDLTTSIKSIFTSLEPSAENTVTLISELAEVVAQEKLLLEEGLELFRTISILELRERSLKCSIIQFELWKQQHRKQQEIPLYRSLARHKGHKSQDISM